MLAPEQIASSALETGSRVGGVLLLQTRQQVEFPGGHPRAITGGLTYMPWSGQTWWGQEKFAKLQKMGLTLQQAPSVLFFSAVLGRALPHHNTRISLRHKFTKPNSTAVSAEEDEAVARGCTGERREMPAGGSRIFLAVISRAEIDFRKLPGELDGLGQTSRGKAGAWKWRGGESCRDLVCSWERQHPFAERDCSVACSQWAAGTIFCSVHSNCQSDVELWFGFFAAEKRTQVRHPHRS